MGNTSRESCRRIAPKYWADVFVAIYITSAPAEAARPPLNVVCGDAPKQSFVRCSLIAASRSGVAGDASGTIDRPSLLAGDALGTDAALALRGLGAAALQIVEV